jgi:xylan 1,4-beta-xylosidase
LVVFACGLPSVVSFGQTGSPAHAETIVVDTRAPLHPFPHFWEKMFGSARATLSLRDSYRS